MYDIQQTLALSDHTNHNNANCSCTIFLDRANLTCEKISLHTGHTNTIQSMFTLYKSL